MQVNSVQSKPHHTAQSHGVRLQEDVTGSRWKPQGWFSSKYWYAYRVCTLCEVHSVLCRPNKFWQGKQTFLLHMVSFPLQHTHTHDLTHTYTLKKERAETDHQLSPTRHQLSPMRHLVRSFHPSPYSSHRSDSPLRLSTFSACPCSFVLIGCSRTEHA